MAKVHPKPSDRGRNSPEPGPTPGTRATQRDTDEQLAPAQAGDEATAWEREEQEHLPPRGAGSQHNQGEEKGPLIHAAESRTESPADEEIAPEEIRTLHAEAGTPAAEFHSGGTRGQSNDNRG
jgi:hypothetical protein